MTADPTPSEPAGVGPVLHHRQWRMFATAGDEPRARRVSDALTLGGALLALAAISFAASPQPGFTSALVDLLNSVPDFLDALWQVLTDLFVLFAIVVILAAAMRRRGSVLRDLLLSIVVAVAVWLVVGRIVQGSWPELWNGLQAVEPPPWYPAPRVAVPGAVVLTASPHLTVPIRRIGRWLLLLTMLSLTVLGAARPLDAGAGALVAVSSAAIIHLAFGSSGGRPGLPLVEAALGQLGVRISALDAAGRQQAGSFLVNAVDEHGDALVVKVFGRDAHDAALVSTLWRTVWYREAGSPLRLGRLQQVEHEAFVTLLARQGGVPTDTVVTAGATVEDDAVLVLRRTGRALTDDDLADPTLTARIWALVALLHAHGIAHQQIDEQHLLADGPDLALVDFGGASVAASETQRRTDEVQAFVTSMLLVGEQAALAGASAALGDDGLTAMLPFVQPSALTPYQRRTVRERDIDLDKLRTDAAAAAEITLPELQRLRRITLGTIVRVVLPALAVVFLISGLAGLDFEELAEALRDATWWLVVVGAIIAQLTRVAQAFATMGAAPVPLAMGPTYALQLAISYVNLAIPTSAARIAVNIRFFQRHGVPPGAAVATGALDGFSGFIIQAILLVVLLLFSGVSLNLDVDSAADSAARILVVVVVIAVAALVLLAVVPTWRRFVLGWAKRLGAEGFGAIRGLQSPRRLALLFGGNLANEMLFALALATFVRALGGEVSLGEVLLINICVSLLSGLIPVPGGIGVAEGGLTFGLVQAGVPQEVAFAAVMIYRLWTFYLPPIWGYFALRWLEKNKHL
jgi:glycosyltransferase 2 family protein